MLSMFGYDIVSTGRVARFENFENLAKAYEHLLNEHVCQGLLPANPIRSKLLARLLGTPPSEAYSIVESLAKTKPIDGDVCEFGVAQGETSTLIANEIIAHKKRLHLFDSFEGLPKPTEKDILKDDIFSLGSMEAYAGTMACSQDMLISRLKSISFPPERYIVHKGFIENLILNDSKLPTKVSFAYVDFDLYEPIKITLNFLNDVTPNGAIIMVDDYDFFSSGAKTAVDEFLKETNSITENYSVKVPAVSFGRFVILTKIG
jgi:hypothetical protein